MIALSSNPKQYVIEPQKTCFKLKIKHYLSGAPNEFIFLYKLKTSVLNFLASWILKSLQFCFRWFNVLFSVSKTINFT